MFTIRNWPLYSIRLMQYVYIPPILFL